MGTRAGLRDSRYSRTANTVHGTGEEKNTERQILGGTWYYSLTPALAGCSKRPKFGLLTVAGCRMGGLGIGWLRGVRGLGGSAEKETVGDLETAKENVLGRRRRRYFLHPCFSSHCGHIIFQIIVFHPAQSATWLLNLTHLDLCICHGLGPLPSGLGQEWTLIIVAASSRDSILLAIPSLFWFVSLCAVFFLLLLVEGWQPVLGRGMSWQTSSQLQPAIWITCRCCCRRWQRWWWWLWWRSC